MTAAGRYRAGDPLTPPSAAKTALHSITERAGAGLDTEIRALDRAIHTILDTIAAPLLARHDLGYDTAGSLLCAAGDNPDRPATQASFAALCGTSPVPVSSGRTNRHRLNRAGDRQANAALWRIVIVRLQADTPTIDHLKRPVTAGNSERDAIRCLNRYRPRALQRHPNHRDHHPTTIRNRCLTPRGASDLCACRDLADRAGKPRMVPRPRRPLLATKHGAGIAVLSADEIVDVFAEVAACGVRPSGFLDEFEGTLDLFVVVGVGGRPTMVDQELEPERSSIQEQKPGAVGPESERTPSYEDLDGQRAVTVVRHPLVLLLASKGDGEGLVVGQVGPRIGRTDAVCEVDQTIRAVWLAREVHVDLKVVAHGQVAAELLDDLAARIVEMLLFNRFAAARPTVDIETATANPAVNRSVRDSLTARLLSADVEPVELAPLGTARPTRTRASLLRRREHRAAVRVSPYEPVRERAGGRVSKGAIGGQLRVLALPRHAR